MVDYDFEKTITEKYFMNELPNLLGIHSKELNERDIIELTRRLNSIMDTNYTYDVICRNADRIVTIYNKRKDLKRLTTLIK